MPGLGTQSCLIGRAGTRDSEPQALQPVTLLGPQANGSLRTAPESSEDLRGEEDATSS